MAFNKPFVYNQQVEELAKRARAATTLEELTNICTKLNIADVIFLGKVDIKLCKYALTAVYRTLRIYPEMRPHINYFGTWNGFVGYKRPLFMKMYPNLPASALDLYVKTSDEQAEQARDMFKHGGCIGLAMQMGITYGFKNCMVGAVLMNGKTFHEDQHQQELQMNVKVGFHPQGCDTIKSVIDHEMGHMLDYVLHVSSSGNFQNYISQFSVKELERGLSGYCVYGGRPDPMEILAEAYAEYRNNPTPREMAMTIGRMVDDAYCQTFKPQHFDTNLYAKRPRKNPSTHVQTQSSSGGAEVETTKIKLMGKDKMDYIKKFFGK